MDPAEAPLPQQPRKKRVGWDHSSAPPSPPAGQQQGQHAHGEPDAIELTRALQILVTEELLDGAHDGKTVLGNGQQESGNNNSSSNNKLSPATAAGSSLIPLKKPPRPALRRNTSHQSRTGSDDENDSGLSGTLTPRVQQGNQAAAGAKARADHLAAKISQKQVKVAPGTETGADHDSEDDDEDNSIRVSVPRPAHTSVTGAHDLAVPSRPARRVPGPSGVPTLTIPAANSVAGDAISHHTRNVSDNSAGDQSIAYLALDDPEYAKIQNLKAAHHEAERLIRSHSRKGIFDLSRRGGGSGTRTPLLPDQVCT